MPKFKQLFMDCHHTEARLYSLIGQHVIPQNVMMKLIMQTEEQSSKILGTVFIETAPNPQFWTDAINDRKLTK